jgi:hypothetical protein
MKIFCCFQRESINMDKLRKVLSNQENRDNDSSTGILPVSKYFI